jgi:hypothetical protein
MHPINPNFSMSLTKAGVIVNFQRRRRRNRPGIFGYQAGAASISEIGSMAAATGLSRPPPTRQFGFNARP